MGKVKIQRLKWQLIASGVLLTALLAFQNCAGGLKSIVNNTAVALKSVTCNDEDCVEVSFDEDELPLDCEFNGETIKDGESVKAFVNGGGACQSETRLCTRGKLSGSYQYASCGVNGQAACLFNDNTIEHGGYTVGYLNSKEASGKSCREEVRACDNGVLSGSYGHSSCTSDSQAMAPCQFNGKTVSHLRPVISYEKSTVPFAETCKSQVRICLNGRLSKGFEKSSCVVGAPKSCEFNGADVPHLGEITAFDKSAVPFGQSCTSQKFRCDNGVWKNITVNGTIASPGAGLIGGLSILNPSADPKTMFASCEVDKPAACNLDGTTVAHGATADAYNAKTGYYSDPCLGHKLTSTCNNGTMSMNALGYKYASCTQMAARSCTYGKYTLQHGNFIKVSIYQPPGLWPYWFGGRPYGIFCIVNVRYCSDGTMWRATVEAPAGDASPYCGNPLMSAVTTEAPVNLSLYGTTDSSGADLYPNPYQLSTRWEASLSPTH